MEEPSKLLLGLEAARSVAEYGLGLLFNAPLKYISPRGDGHPVLVIPGLGGSDGSTQYLRNFLNSIGYTSYTWGLGRNLGPRQGMDKLATDLINRVNEVSEAHNGEQITLIGWSLGGIYSREIAKMCPDLIRQVITLGTPFKAINESTNVGKIYELLSKDKSIQNPEILQKLSEPPPVPFTSMYSKTDGVVNWHSSIEDETEITQNIEIPGSSHLGLGHNPIVMYLIADRLTQTRDHWEPFKAQHA
jgi:esterase/lipase